jgi:hypothetical protein
MAHSSNSNRGRGNAAWGSNGRSIPASRLNWQAPRSRRAVRWRGGRITLPTAQHARVIAHGFIPPRAIFRPEPVKNEHYPRDNVGLYSCWVMVIIIFICSVILVLSAFL